MVNAYTSYYLNQSGGGLIGNIYRAPYVGIQRGRGLGSIFGGLMRFLRPIFKSGLNAVKDQAIKSGISVLQDIGTSNKPLKNILLERGIEARDNLKNRVIKKIRNKMDGRGINRVTSRKKIIRKTKADIVGPTKKNILRRIISTVSKGKGKRTKKSNPNKRKRNKNNTKERTLDIFT